jgi:hypothetical protein
MRRVQDLPCGINTLYSRGVISVHKYTVIIGLVFFASCAFDSLPGERRMDVIDKTRKSLIFRNVQLKLGEAYSGNNARFVYDSLKEVLGEHEFSAFEDDVSSKNIFYKTRSYRISAVDTYYQFGDIVFTNTQSLADPTLGFVNSYDFSSGKVSYITVLNNKISLRTAFVDRTGISFRQLTTITK